MITEAALANLLREAEEAHKKYEHAWIDGRVDAIEWPEFYANYMLLHLTRLWP